MAAAEEALDVEGWLTAQGGWADAIDWGKPEVEETAHSADESARLAHMAAAKLDHSFLAMSPDR